jgi:predicted MarR family transcription regulator
LDDLPKFLEKYSPRKKAQLQEASENNGEPHTVVVTASGVRAVDLKRWVRLVRLIDIADTIQQSSECVSDKGVTGRKVVRKAH